MKSLQAFLLAVVPCILSQVADGADWPQWRGPHRDAKVAGFQAPQSWPAELTKKWKVVVGDGVATPALVGEKLYVFSREEGNEVIRCLDAANGEERWLDKYEAKGATGPAAGFSGPRSSPTVSDGKLVTLGVRGTLSCFDATTGQKLWRKDDAGESLPRFFTSCSPIVVDDLCIVQLGGERDGEIVAYDLISGDEKWKWTGDGTAYSSPVLFTLDGMKLLIAETANKIVAIALADGTLQWETPFVVQGRGYNAATPLVDGQSIIYAGSGRGTSAVTIEKQPDGVAAKELWHNADNSVQFSTPVLKDGLVFGISDRDNLFCINAQNGQTAWSSAMASRSRLHGYGSVVDAGSVLIALMPSAQLTIFEPTGKEFKELASYKVSEGETFAYPVVDGDRVFIKDTDSVTLWTIK
jgi:outer membrane protein assembly factor BamB